MITVAYRFAAQHALLLLGASTGIGPTLYDSSKPVMSNKSNRESGMISTGMNVRLDSYCGLAIGPNGEAGAVMFRGSQQSPDGLHIPVMAFMQAEQLDTAITSYSHRAWTDDDLDKNDQFARKQLKKARRQLRAYGPYLDLHIRMAHRWEKSTSSSLGRSPSAPDARSLRRPLLSPKRLPISAP